MTYLPFHKTHFHTILIVNLQTRNARERKEKLKEKRKAMMAARLAKVRQRKMINNPEAERGKLTMGQFNQSFTTKIIPCNITHLKLI